MKCKYGSCRRPVKAKGYCQSHWKRVKAGLPLEEIPRRLIRHRRLCSVPGCRRLYLANNFCRLHYKRVKAHGACGPAMPHRFRNRECSVRGCSRDYRANGYCGMHLQRNRKYGSPGQASPLVRRGGQPLDKNGYLHLYMPESVHAKNNYVAIHRLAMAEHLGRKLLSNETVHHKNGDRADNRLDNLELWASFHPSGQRVTDRIVDAISVLKAYSNDSVLWPDILQKLRAYIHRST